MIRATLYATGLVLSFLLGTRFAANPTLPANDKSSVNPSRPAYLVASWDILHPDQLKPFVDAALPLAQKAGYQMLASADPRVLEGDWPYKGIVIVQEYPSMHGLLDFWNSSAHEAVTSISL